MSNWHWNSVTVNIEQMKSANIVFWTISLAWQSYGKNDMVLLSFYLDCRGQHWLHERLFWTSPLLDGMKYQSCVANFTKTRRWKFIFEICKFVFVFLSSAHPSAVLSHPAQIGLQQHSHAWFLWTRVKTIWERPDCLFILKLARFFTHCTGEWKASQFQNKQISSGNPVVLILP